MGPYIHEMPFITLHPWQVVDSDPGGLLEYEAELLREWLKPKTIYLGKFRIIMDKPDTAQGGDDGK